MTNPTDAPTWVDGVPGVGRVPVLVTGATGTLGSAVLQELARSHVPARALTRTPDPAHEQQVRGDLRTGDGLAEAVRDVQAVIHCASDPRHPQEVDVDGTRLLTEVLTREAPQAHLVLISIVGAQGNPLHYYQAKVRSETIVTAWSGPSSVLRATQFHTLVEQLTQATAPGALGVGLGLRGLRFAPVDPAYVAVRAVDVALSPPLSEPLEVAGPEIHSAREIAVLTARLAARRPPRLLPIPAVGGVLQAFARGSNLPGPDVERGGSTYAEWAARRISSA